MTVHDIGDGLLTLAAVLGAACVAAYQATTRGAWRTTETGRHLMAFMLSEAVVLGLGAVAIAVAHLGGTTPEWFLTLRVAVFTSVPLVFVWRLRLILAAWWETRRRTDA